MPFWVYRPVFAIMTLAGYRVVAHSLAENNILVGDNAGLVSQVNEVIRDVQTDIVRLQSLGTSFFAVFGNSLGSELAMAVAKQTPEVAGIILNTVRGSTSEFIWHAPYAVGFKQLYKSRGYSEAQMYRELKLVEATNNLTSLGKRPVLLYYSKADSTIPPRNTELLITALAASHIVHTLVRNKYLGHFGASVKNHLYFWTWLGFLRTAEYKLKTHS